MSTNHTSAGLRSRFLDFFRKHGHTVVPSSPLVPGDDPTLLFTNAGMVQFKDVFLGREKLGFVRAVSSQRCVRAGGKHNDLDNVGYTARHHTFFEMLGNFSFGDYFKEDAIGYAWRFLTQELGLPADRLWVTVYETDDDAYRIWTEVIGVPAERCGRIGDDPSGGSDNFWQMGDTGPCGPCSEIFYDHGPEVAGGPPGSADADGDRYVEIWNLVFMQFDRAPDGKLHPLPKPSVDTGMGLERLAAVMQGVQSNYDTDVFRALVADAARVVGVPVSDAPSLRVIADHIRACAFLVVDGVLPSNEGRGYVLRRIIRRAVRHGYKLGANDAFFHKLVEKLDELMGDAYPELRAARKPVERALLAEEQRFAETLEQGMAILEDVIAGMKGNEIPGDTVFKLYDTYGFPVDLTADIARERELSVDQQGFERAMEAQRERGRAASQFGGDYARIELDAHTDFIGYERTPFYAESGGQVGDTGKLFNGDAEFVVDDTRKHGQHAHLHVGKVRRGTLRKGTKLTARVETARRSATVLNHSATHLLHAALRQVLGPHVQQKGSLVAPDRLRFDFSHPQPLAKDELATIERLVNTEVRRNHDADIREMGMDEAVAAGAIALFGEKYGERVRVLRFGDFSVELCGGTHVRRTGDIGLFKITSEGGVSSGVRRIEAVTGDGALTWVAEEEATLDRIAATLRTGRDGVEDRIAQAVDRARKLERELEKLRAQLAGGGGGQRDLADQAVELGDCKLVAARVDGADAKSLRAAVDRLRDKLGSAVVVLATVTDGKVLLAAGVTADRTKATPAGELVRHVATQVGGKGGGKADFAQAGGTEPANIDAALASVTDWVKGRLCC
ncbi:MAG: alanine--tRNA ligase [Xanthomonadaceae bacterium]|nr:alanine--tRNA ligase [Xanthomonadaceae bacterium]